MKDTKIDDVTLIEIEAKPNVPSSPDLKSISILISEGSESDWATSSFSNHGKSGEIPDSAIMERVNKICLVGEKRTTFLGDSVARF